MERLRGLVEDLANIQPARSADSPESLDRAARRIAEALAQAGLHPRFDAYEVEGERFRNVSALIGSGKRARWVVGAHYDVWGDQPGADDNASGVAALVHVASRLGGRRLSADVELVAFTLEEPPFFRSDDMGSARHARSLAAAGVRVEGMISLEMLGYYSDDPGSQSFPDVALASRFPTTGNFLAVVGRRDEQALVDALVSSMGGVSDLPVHGLAAPQSLPGIDFSDHLSFWRAGIPAVMVTDTAFLRNPHYHRATDRPDTLDYERLLAAADAVAEGVAAIAGPS